MNALPRVPKVAAQEVSPADDFVVLIGREIHRLHALYIELDERSFDAAAAVKGTKDKYGCDADERVRDAHDKAMLVLWDREQELRRSLAAMQATSVFGALVQGDQAMYELGIIEGCELEEKELERAVGRIDRLLCSIMTILHSLAPAKAHTILTNFDPKGEHVAMNRLLYSEGHTLPRGETGRAAA